VPTAVGLLATSPTGRGVDERWVVVSPSEVNTTKEAVVGVEGGGSVCFSADDTPPVFCDGRSGSEAAVAAVNRGDPSRSCSGK
jgi:hypothetical protein